MNKIRLIPTLFIKNGYIVRSEKFKHHKKIGNVVNQVQRYNQWNVDELIFIDISREKTYDTKRDDHKIKRVNSIYQIVDMVSKECFMPLSFGGGIRELDTIKKMINKGADKVILNTLIHKNPKAIISAVKLFGSQAIVGAIDYKFSNNEFQFFVENGTEELNIKFKELINYFEDLGIGEIFLNSIDNDGAGEGYDLKTINLFLESTNLPIVACGGASSIFDFKELSKLKGISGVAAGNIFHFTENIYPRAKKELKSSNLNFR